jgi:hypothetical protein
MVKSSLTVTVAVGDFVVCQFLTWIMMYNYGAPHPLLLIVGQLHTYIKCISIFYCGWQSYGSNPSRNMLGLTDTVVVGESLGFSLAAQCSLWLLHPAHFILISDRFYTYMNRSSIFYCGWHSCGFNPSLIYAWACSHSCGGWFSRFLTWIMIYDMIGKSHTLHTPTRSFSYIFKCFVTFYCGRWS